MIVPKLFVYAFLALPLWAFGQTYRYASFFDPPYAGVRITSADVEVADRGYPVSWCDQQSQFVCMKSDVFVFSIPRKNAGVTNWKYGDEKYEVLSSRETVVNGEVTQVRIVRQTWKNAVMDFAYSDEFGVLAIKILGHELNLAQGKCGFTAISNKFGCESTPTR